MHRQVLGLTPNDVEQVSHKNRNGLDNRRSNLSITGVVNCLRCGKEFIQNNSRHVYCWDCKNTGYLIRHRFMIYKRDNFQCAYCGTTSYSGAELQIDHIVPESFGGEGKAYNLITACKECNRSKYDVRLDISIELELLAEVERRNKTNNIIPGTEIVSKSYR